MNAKTRTQTETRIDMRDEVSRFALNTGMGMAALIGIWGLACLIGGLVTSGAGSLLREFVTAVIGS